jgi:hypothetical protein
VIANLFILLPAACRQVGMRVAEFSRMVAITPLAGAVPAIATVLGFRRLLPPESIGAILAEGAVVGLVYLASAFTFGLRSSERARYFDYVRRLVAIRSGRLRTAQA